MVHCAYLLALLCISVCLTVASASLPLASDASRDIHLVRRGRKKDNPVQATTYGVRKDPEEEKHSFPEEAENRAGPDLSPNLVTPPFSHSKDSPFHDYHRHSEIDKGAALLLSLSKPMLNREEKYLGPLETTL